MKNIVSITTMRAAVCVDRKSTRLNSSHSQISYAVFCLKKKKKNLEQSRIRMMSNHIQTSYPHLAVKNDNTCSTLAYAALHKPITHVMSTFSTRYTETTSSL